MQLPRASPDLSPRRVHPPGTVLRAQFGNPGSGASTGFAACEVEIDSRKSLTAKGAKNAKKIFMIFFAIFAVKVLLPDPLPDHVLVISPINQDVDFAMLATRKKQAAFDTFAEKSIVCLGHQQNLVAARALGVQVIAFEGNGLS